MSTAATSSKPPMRLRLLIDTKANIVLFAEAGKDFVDFLFHFLSLPMGTVTRLVSANRMIGSLGNVYLSLETLTDPYLQPGADKSKLLGTTMAGLDFAANVQSRPSILATNPPVYRCGNCPSLTLTLDPNDSCDGCSRTMSCSLPFKTAAASSPDGGGGYARPQVTHVVMDDLEVKPLVTVSILWKKYAVRAPGELQDLYVSIGVDEGLKLLMASMESKTVLTDVFLRRGNNTETGSQPM